VLEGIRAHDPVQAHAAMVKLLQETRSDIERAVARQRAAEGDAISPTSATARSSANG